MEDLFGGDALDLDVWVPHYLPHWSSRASSAATYEVSGGELRLSIPPEQGLWCEDRHDGPLRVSGVQSASFSGPVGSPVGGQPFKDGLLVTSEEPEFWGYTPLYGHVEVRARGVISPRSMVAFWLSGIEDKPQHSGEICVMEVFGDAVRPDSTDVGIGLHKFRDPGLTEDWSAQPLDLDVSDFHTYAVDWAPGSLVFTVDGERVKRIGQSPNYPVQLMLAVFDFPDKATPDDNDVPELIVSHVLGRPLK
ncbi:glycoside hydrolase family 16 protein [Actinoplanes friuliensis]|uniref:Glycoside hydrolase family 16 n=1 Tax=Actinoplanes friuliensis DSM 7358 TaxID=1246995 RepID=U5WFQ7_9ACTN|nr:glycoside hydrolase family 16 protein [Actinoplanes friuliensis]AGZ46761.1 glycoside hydrolase family 16 [Actinoplanes friuliensis DSM 7358]